MQSIKYLCFIALFASKVNSTTTWWAELQPECINGATISLKKDFFDKYTSSHSEALQTRFILTFNFLESNEVNYANDGDCKIDISGINTLMSMMYISTHSYSSIADQESCLRRSETVIVEPDNICYSGRISYDCGSGSDHSQCDQVLNSNGDQFYPPVVVPFNSSKHSSVVINLSQYSYLELSFIAFDPLSFGSSLNCPYNEPIYISKGFQCDLIPDCPEFYQIDASHFEDEPWSCEYFPLQFWGLFFTFFIVLIIPLTASFYLIHWCTKNPIQTKK